MTLLPAPTPKTARPNASGALPRTRPATSALFVALALFLALLPAHARINVVSLPGRDSTQLTIYNSADLTLVKETRHLTFRRGLNRLEFSWANTLIDPTSLEFRALTHADQVELLDVSFPPRLTNTLEWRIQSEFAGEVVVEIRYFTSGITWSANYVVEAATDEKQMGLLGQVAVTNRSGEDYENAQVRLVVGVIRLVEDIADLARPGRPVPPQVPVPIAKPAAPAARRRVEQLALQAVAEDASMDKRREVIKEELSEYFLYTVEGRDTIPNGWSKRMQSLHAEAVPITSYYKFEKERWADQVIRYYRFTNSVAGGLGKEPLPDGSVQAFRIAGNDRLYHYIGATRTKYIPINETVELELGPDPEVRVAPRLMNWEKSDLRFDGDGNVSGWTLKESWEVEVQNSRSIEVMLDIRRNFQGDWALESATSFEKVDASKVKFAMPLKPGEQKTFRYVVTTRHGTSASK